MDNLPKTSGSRGDLVTWYLARLRNNARQTSVDRKLTPLTLVATDKTLIQELVMNSQVGHEQKSADILRQLQKQNKNIRNAFKAIVAIGVVATVALFSILLL